MLPLAISFRWPANDAVWEGSLRFVVRAPTRRHAILDGLDAAEAALAPTAEVVSIYIEPEGR